MTVTSAPDEAAIRRFLFDQVGHWNAARKPEFLGAYDAIAPAGLTIEYVGKKTFEGDAAWDALGHMWDAHVADVTQQLIECIVNGTDAACVYRNLRAGTATLGTGIEIYSFRDGALHLRLFH
jgi:hypothetical protein